MSSHIHGYNAEDGAWYAVAVGPNGELSLATDDDGNAITLSSASIAGVPHMRTSDAEAHLMAEIVTQLKIMNLHLYVITGATFGELNVSED